MLRFSPFWIASITTLMRHRGNFVAQTGRTDCGVASTLSVLRMMSRPADPVEAVDHMDPDRTGTTLDALRLYFLNQHEIQASALSVPADRLSTIRGHVILHMTQQHYVVLLRTSRAGVLVFDPSVGPVFYPMADFSSLYSGFLLQIPTSRKPSTLPVVSNPSPLISETDRRGIAPVALFIIGFATRLLECAILLCLVVVLFLVLNRASLSSMLLASALIGICGALLLVAHQLRYDGENGWIRRTQSRLWRGLLRISFRGRDLNGFRGRYERDVSGAVRKGLSVAIPQRAQVPAALGAFCAVPALLWFLSPIMAALHVTLFGFVLMVTQLDSVQICRRSVRQGIGRYSKLSQGHDMLNAVSAPDLIGEVAKWSVIGFAGFSVLQGALPPVALMFWILAAMQIVPSDFRRAMTLAPGLAAAEPLSPLTASEVPLRRQQIVGPVDLTVSHEPGLIRIDGLTALTIGLQQPDLTVREQRLIMADVVRNAFANLPQIETASDIGPIRIFGPGQNATQADFEHLVIARESRPHQSQPEALPVPVDSRKLLDMGQQDPVLRDLHSCEPGDFPVFWDFRERLAVKELQARLKDLGLPRAAHMTMNRLTLVEAA